MTVDERTSVLPYAGRTTDHLVDELPTTALAVVGAPPVFVDDSGRRRRTLAGLGSAIAALCVLYPCVVVLGVLRGADNPLLGPVGLLPAAEAPEVAAAASPVTTPVAELPVVEPARTASTGTPAAVVPAPVPLTGPAAGTVVGSVDGAAEAATRPDPTNGTRPPRAGHTMGGAPADGAGAPAPEPTSPATGEGGAASEGAGTGGTGTGTGEPEAGTGGGDGGAAGDGAVIPTDLPAGSTP